MSTLYRTLESTVDYNQVVDSSTKVPSNTDLLDPYREANISFGSATTLHSLRDHLTTLTKLANVKVAKGLIRSTKIEHNQVAIDMMKCGRFISNKTSGNRPVILNRCHKRICPICNTIKSNKYSYFVKRATLQLGYHFVGEAAD